MRWKSLEMYYTKETLWAANIVNMIYRLYDLYPNEDTHSVMRAIGVSHTACKDEFRQFM